MSNDQEQPPFDLAEGERLLAAASKYWMRAYSDSDTSIAIKEFSKYEVGRYVAILLGRDGEPESELEHREANAAVIVWLRNNGEALVTALKAAIEQYQIACDLVEQTEAERDTARDDLARVEAESKHNGDLATGYFKSMGEYATNLTAAQARIAELEAKETEFDQAIFEIGMAVTRRDEVEAINERLEQRIAELAGSLRELLDEHTTDTMIPYWEGDVQHLRYGNCECSVCERARAKLEPQTPTAS